MDAALNATSIAYENCRVVKPKPGVLLGLTGYNSKVSTQFILIFDSATIPADGAIPSVVMSVAASSGFSLDYTKIVRQFKYGIVICNSSTGPTKTVGSADCWFDCQYI